MTLVKSKIKSKLPASERKRTGQHHKRSQNYNKTYWPYLPVVLIFGLGILINSSLTNRAKLSSTSSSFSYQSLLDSTNAERSSNHETPLTSNTLLSRAAQAKAEAMVNQNFWSHTTPSGLTTASYLTSAGYSYQKASENLAYGFSNASQTVSGWMVSSQHRQNILNSSYQNVGFGVASSPNYLGKGPETIVVAEYAQPVSSSFGQAIIENSQGNILSASSTKSTIIARIQLLTGENGLWSLTLVSVVTILGFLIFLVRHTKKFKKLVIDGEHLVTEHYMVDIVLAIVITAGFILTRTTGVIR